MTAPAPAITLSPGVTAHDLFVRRHPELASSMKALADAGHARKEIYDAARAALGFAPLAAEQVGDELDYLFGAKPAVQTMKYSTKRKPTDWHELPAGEVEIVQVYADQLIPSGPPAAIRIMHPSLRQPKLLVHVFYMGPDTYMIRNVCGGKATAAGYIVRGLKVAVPIVEGEPR